MSEATEKPRTVWITKYALTKGIYSCRATNAQHASERDIGMIRDVDAAYMTFYFRPHWHETKDAAVARVKVMVAAKRKAIAKQLAKLDALEKGLGQ